MKKRVMDKSYAKENPLESKNINCCIDARELFVHLWFNDVTIKLFHM